VAVGAVTLHHGDCIEVMAGMDPESVDAIVTDPPYGLAFMGKEWDSFKKSGGVFHGGGPNGLGKTEGKWRLVDPPRFIGGSPAQAFHFAWAEAAYRVAKPSAYLLAFGGTRTVHRMTVALEDAGWIIRDMLVWGYASGFPKSKASLKPAWEPIVMARKPGPLRMLAIDECRIGFASPAEVELVKNRSGGQGGVFAGDIYGDEAPGYRVNGERFANVNASGRWPANIVLTDPIFDGGVEGVVGGGEASYNPPGKFGEAASTHWLGARTDERDIFGYGDSGTYSRFFLIPKADRADREPVLGGLPLAVVKTQGKAEGWTWDEDGGHSTGDNRKPRANVHPTVKPVDLMRHLVRLVTPTGGTVLDPFAGSGSTLLAAEMEGFPWVGIEREAEYVAIAEARLNGTQRGLGLGA
jgi:site-specific DNA-methyltransferase (adenine-specific)